MNPIELLILDRPVEEVHSLHDVRVVLAHRDDKDYPDCWHHPGSYLGGGEYLRDGAPRVAFKELGVQIEGLHEIKGMNFPKHPRDHELCMLMVSNLAEGSSLAEAGETGEIGIFPFDRIPANLIPQHRVIQRQLEEWLVLALRMPIDVRRDFFKFCRVFDSDL